MRGSENEMQGGGKLCPVFFLHMLLGNWNCDKITYADWNFEEKKDY